MRWLSCCGSRCALITGRRESGLPTIYTMDRIAGHDAGAAVRPSRGTGGARLTTGGDA